MNVCILTKIGKQNSGAQTLSLDKSACVKLGTVAHELMHAIGTED